jgi:adenine deaminase
MSTTTLRGVTVVDTRDGSLAPDMDVTLTGDRITSVTHAGGEPTGTPVDVAGKYLVPGYLDMHAHPLELKDPAGTPRKHPSRPRWRPRRAGAAAAASRCTR